MKLLLDTHIWIWSHLEPERLTQKVRTALSAANTELYLSPISVWESMLLIERGRVVIEGNPGAWIESAWSLSGMKEAPLSREVAIQSRTVKVPHQDPADRFLAATAQVCELTLVTSDDNLLRGKGFAKLANR